MNAGEGTNPDLEKIIMISKYFDISLDILLLGNDNRVVEQMKPKSSINPEYQNMHDWEFYSSNLNIEYRQAIEEGLDVECYKDVFCSVSLIPKGDIKKKLGDVLFEAITAAKRKDGYKYVEPSDLEGIKSLRKNRKNNHNRPRQERICRRSQV